MSIAGRKYGVGCITMTDPLAVAVGQQRDLYNTLPTTNSYYSNRLYGVLKFDSSHRDVMLPTNQAVNQLLCRRRVHHRPVWTWQRRQNSDQKKKYEFKTVGDLLTMKRMNCFYRYLGALYFETI
jgi:Leucine-rich repeat (LRR) protein